MGDVTDLERLDPATVAYQVPICEGKYTAVYFKDGRAKAYRYGGEWRDLTGDKFIYSLCVEIDELRKTLPTGANGA